LVERRPYASVATLMADAEAVWFEMPESEWLAAFACHPRIGERKAEMETTRQFADWSGNEQGAAQATLEEVARALADLNRAYEAKIGFLYIVFASGRTAPELLAVLQERLEHDRATELMEAARQQWEITRLRMGKWLHDEGARAYGLAKRGDR
jgi:2-oxo-4-hydroxy-4-carboxy-5-ureidoimidazoline decarboxylase